MADVRLFDCLSSCPFVHLSAIPSRFLQILLSQSKLHETSQNKNKSTLATFVPFFSFFLLVFGLFCYFFCQDATFLSSLCLSCHLIKSKFQFFYPMLAKICNLGIAIFLYFYLNFQAFPFWKWKKSTFKQSINKTQLYLFKLFVFFCQFLKFSSISLGKG